MSIREYWDRYFWLIALIALSIFLFVCLYGREPFCGPNEHCIREWVSALSGWVAAAGALLTIQAMLRIQRENVEISLHPSITLARRVKRRCYNAEINVKKVRKGLQDIADGGAAFLSADEVTAFTKIHRAFYDDDFNRFEDVTFVGATYLRSARIALDRAHEHLKIKNGATRPSSAIAINANAIDDIMGALDRVEEHIERLNSAAETFIEKWQRS